MENNKVIQPEPISSQSKSLILTADEKKRLTDFFSILIEIDRRTNITQTYDKPTNWNSNYTY